MSQKAMSFREMVKEGDIDGVKANIRKVTNINRRNCHGETFLHAVTFGSNEARLEITKLLIEAGANVNAGDNDGYTPLFASRSVQITKLLIEAGADVNAKNKKDNTPLHFHCIMDVDSARLLINAGADVNARSKNGQTPLHFALYQNFSCSVEIVKALIKAGADVNARNNKGRTPLEGSIEIKLEAADIVKSEIERRSLQENVAQAQPIKKKAKAFI